MYPDNYILANQCSGPVITPFYNQTESSTITYLNAYLGDDTDTSDSECTSVSELLAAFETRFKPRTYDEHGLVIWNHGVDRFIEFNNLTEFIHTEFFYSIVNNQNSLKLAQATAKEVYKNTLGKYEKYPLINEQYVLFNNVHFNINQPLSNINPLKLPDSIDIDLCRCKYRVKANFIKNYSQSEICYIFPESPRNIDYFIRDISGGDLAIMLRIWQVIGYLLTPDTNARALFLLQGESSTGKSILGKVISALFEERNVSNLNIKQLGSTLSAKALSNKHLNISMDLPNEPIPSSSVSFIKQLTGGDDCSKIFSYGNLHKIFGHCKFLFATNHPLIIKGADNAFISRIVTIPFLHPIPKERQNPRLFEILMSEADYIVTKASFMYQNLVFHNYVFAGTELDICKPNVVSIGCPSDEANTIIMNFATDECVFGKYKIHTRELYYAYRQYCQEHSYQYLDNPKSFSRVFKKCFDFKVSNSRWRFNGNENLHGFKGVTLKTLFDNNEHQEDIDLYYEYLNFNK